MKKMCRKKLGIFINKIKPNIHLYYLYLHVYIYLFNLFNIIFFYLKLLL